MKNRGDACAVIDGTWDPGTGHTDIKYYTDDNIKSILMIVQMLYGYSRVVDVNSRVEIPRGVSSGRQLKLLVVMSFNFATL